MNPQVLLKEGMKGNKKAPRSCAFNIFAFTYRKKGKFLILCQKKAFTVF